MRRQSQGRVAVSGRSAARPTKARAPRAPSRPLPLDESDDERLDDALRFLRSLWRLDHALHSASKGMAKTVGVTGPQRFVLRMLGRFEALSGGEMARLLALHPSTLTGVLHRLARAGLLERRPASDDARRMVLTLSTKGRKHDRLKPGTIEATVRQVLAQTSPRDVRATRRLLNALADALHQR
jgi:DNA-binding MarR family transcriptional regulator